MNRLPFTFENGGDEMDGNIATVIVMVCFFLCMKISEIAETAILNRKAKNEEKIRKALVKFVGAVITGLVVEALKLLIF
jgi:hypothetical protein